MGQICKREHGSKQAALAALVATGLLAAVLALAGLAAPAPAYAAGLQGKGTADDPVLIYNTDDLIAWCRDMLNPLPDEDEYNQHARLMADLTEGHGGVVTDDVIGKMSHNNLKVAEFDGNGHLMELQITGKNGGALFVTGGKPSDAGGPTVIKNLNIIGQVQNANQHGGGTSRAATLFEAVGQDEKGARHDRWLEIRDCTNQASVAGDDAAGGFIGKYYDHGEGSLVIEGCANFGDISADGGAGDNSGFAGGIVGYIKTTSPSVPCTLQRCSNNGAITALNTRGACSAGGVVGYMYVEESQGYDLGYCFNQGAVTVSGSTSHAGGVVGLLDGPNVALPATTACYSTGQIEAAAAANSGGIFGGLNVSSPLSKCFTLTGSVQDESHASSDLNGTFRYRYEFMTDVASDMDYDVYAGGSHHTCLKYPEYDFPMLRGVATGKKITLTWVMPLNGESTQSECYWNTVPDSMPTMEAPEGYRFVYWTTEAPTAGTWDTPPAEYKADENDIYDRIYGGDDHVFYAYCVPNSYTVEFDLNAPSDQKQCRMQPAAPATKTVMEGEPLGALPVCTNGQTVENGGRAFLGWVTAYDDATNTESFWVDENTVLDAPSDRKLTLYAQWGTPRLSAFVITSQPEDCVVSAAADAPREAREATFSFATNYKTSNYDYFDAMLQKKVAGTWVDVKYAGRNKTSCTIDVDYPDQAALEYRFRIEYRDSDYEGFIATTSANIVLDIPVTTARITSINPLDDTAADKVLGTHSYDINVELSDIVELMGAYKYRYAHTAWIEGGPDNIVTDKGYYEDFPFTMENQTLREGQTYTLCVAHVVNKVNALVYEGESEPYRVEFTVPYSDSVVTDITSAQVTKDPVVKDGNPVDFNADYSVPLEGTFNVVADAQWAQPVTRGVTAQWQYKPSGGSWTDVPDEYYAEDGSGMTWNGDKTAARMHASLNAKAALNGARFRVRLSTPPATADAASGASAKDLVVNVPTPVLGEPKVTNDTHLSLSWAWEDGAGNTLANDGYYVKVESEYGSGGGYSRTDHVYANTYDATLNSQVDYTVKVWASVDGLQGPSSETTFKTTGPMELTWRYDYLTYYLAEGKNDYLSVQHSWAKYNDGKHAARYEWQLSKDVSDPATFDTFAVTEANEAKFPASFKSDKQPWDVEEAQWVRVSAAVWELDDQGEPAREVEGTRAYATPVPIVHETTAPQNVSARDVGSHSATICWDAPDKGLVREYQVEVGGQKRIVEAKEGQTSYAVTVDGLASNSSSEVKVSTFDPRKGTDYSGVIASTYSSVTTLPSPEAGTWTAAANPDTVDLTDTVTLSASYKANSGSFESAEVQWYSWREGDEAWEPVEGSEMTFNGADQTHTATFDYRVMSDDYGRQWKLGVKAGTPDEHVTGSSNAVTTALTLSAPTKVTLGESTTTSIPVTWDAVEGVEGDDSGYLVQRELIRDNYIVGIHTYRLNASDLDVDGDGNLHYVMENLKPDTEYRVAVAVFAGSVRSDYKYQYTNGKTKPVEVRPPVFVEVPKSKKPDAFNDATFDAKVAVEPDQGELEYRWQRKEPGEQEFTDVVLGDKYQVSAYNYSDGLGITLAVKNVEAADVGAAFRCVAAHVRDGQRAETISGAAYLYVDVQDPQSVQATAQGSTTAEVTWEPAGLVRRFTVDYQREGGGDASWQQSVVTLDSDAEHGSCLLEGLAPNTKYLVKVTAAPQAGFSSQAVDASFTTKPASELATATVSATPDDKVVDPGTQVTYKVETNVDGKPGEALSYRWQYNSFGEGWYDVDGAPNANELAVTAPDAGTAIGYRCIVASSKDGGDETSVTSSAALLLTRVAVEPPVRLAAETDTTSAHLSWEGNDVRPAAYEVQYAEGPTPPEDGSDAWVSVENVGEGTSCDVEGLAPNTVYSWRVRAVVRDELRSDWAMGQSFTTLAETSALTAVSVTPRWGVSEVKDVAGVDYAVTTNLDNIQSEEALSYQWQRSDTGDAWENMDGQAKRAFTATGSSVVPHRCFYRCVVTASKGGETLKTLASEPVSFMTVPKTPTGLKADGITATAASLAWTPSLYEGDGLSYEVLWRQVGTVDWQSDSSGREPAYALSGLMPATTYEWCVQVMNGNAPSAARSATSTFVTQSLRPLLTRVVVDPVDQTLDHDGQAVLTAYTNVDATAEPREMTYEWQKRPIGSDENAWETISGEDTHTITLGTNVDGFVRCKVTYNPNGLVNEPLAGFPMFSDEARVRFMPTLPADLAASNTTQTTAALAWTASQSQGLSGYEVEYRAVGTEAWNALTSGAAETSVEAKDLTPGTVYEWHVRALAYADADELYTDWADAAPFATQPADIVLSKVEVAPRTTSVMVDTGRTITLTATTDADAAETLEHQWQSKKGSYDWADVNGATAATLEVSTKDMTAGEYGYRCVVTATRDHAGEPKKVESGEAVVTVTPVAPTDLSVTDLHRVHPDNPDRRQVEGTFHFAWDGAFDQPDEVQFEISYQKIAGDGAPADWKIETFPYDKSMAYVIGSMEDEGLTYQWRARAVQNGVASPWSEVETFNTTLKEPEELDWVEVTPSDKLLSTTDSVTLEARTNADKESKDTLAYVWEWCELADDPRKISDEDWSTIDDENSDTLTLSPDEQKPTNNKANRYVRCQVTQTIDGVPGDPVASNPARVRVEPLPPTGLTASIGGSAYNNYTVILRWDCDDSRAGGPRDDKKVFGFDVSYRKVSTSEWVEVPWQSYYDWTSSTLPSSSLEADATYEWRVRSALSNNLGGWAAGGPHTEWVYGSTFTTPKVDVTPTTAAAVIGNGRTITFTATPNDAAVNGKAIEYTWQRNDGTGWKTVPNAPNAPTLNVVADDATAAGTSRYRCEVHVDNLRYTTSNEVSLTLAPAAPTNLTTSNIESSTASLAWDWTSGALAADRFEVFYRESGTEKWYAAEVGDGAKTYTLEGLEPQTAYEWYVQAVQKDGFKWDELKKDVRSLPSSMGVFATSSEIPPLTLEAVAVKPADQTLDPTDRATLTASTNLDGVVVKDALAYTWERRALDSDPSDDNAWELIEGKDAREVQLDAGTSGYVRCTATYTPVSGDAQTQISDEVRVVVRTLLDAPTDLSASVNGSDEAALSWQYLGTLPTGGTFSLSYRVADTSEWTVVGGIKESPYTLNGLASNTTYEWRVCAVSVDGFASEWASGEKFTTSALNSTLESAAAAPLSAEAVAGESALVADFFVKDIVGGEGEALAYQWQSKVGATWVDLPGENGERTHLSVATWEAGKYALRCAVTATPTGGTPKTVYSDEVSLALSPMVPGGLDAREVTRDTATLAWTWAGPGTADSVEFNVQYREEGASDTDWVEVPAGQIDAANMTCSVDGLVSGTSYEWQVQAEQGGQTSGWSESSGFVTLSGGSLKIARIWPPDVVVAPDKQASFAVFTNRGDAEDVSYEWQYRALDSLEDAWETIPNATGRILKLDANTSGYVRCVARQAAPAAEMAEVAEVVETPEMSAAPEANETLGANEVPEVIETFAATEPAVVYSNQARVRVEPHAPSGLAVSEVGFRDAALSWAASDAPDGTYTVAYRVAGTDEWTEVADLSTPAYALEGLVPGTRYEWRVQSVAIVGGDPLASEWAHGDSFTTQALKTYRVTAGADGTWKPGQPGLSFTIDAPRDEFQSVTVDGVKLVLGTDYTLADDGMTVTLSPDYLAKLAVGKHALVATFANGTASTSFTVASVDPGPTPNPNPPTPTPTPVNGDGNGGKVLAPTGDPLAPVPVVAAALAAACVALVARRKMS
ncbi:hypothetical protein C1878_03955 [Gordonibacter sp. 28C]|uniref:fibronectin type III domain-containing protein n=1 Tax=Gordonibacter sp. 28C TaxID=2078569 RepID=UPI000DF7BD5D|nr:fibronectin type III domain-containing protein [Gordonibacter sp. 28C]RDB63950.1 hypothetical protein C1878_03955 [Gordonibacter sp. 28C]